MQGCGVSHPEAQPNEPLTLEELREIDGYLSEFCRLFCCDIDEILSAPFTVVTPDSKDPYRQMYVAN